VIITDSDRVLKEDHRSDCRHRGSRIRPGSVCKPLRPFPCRAPIAKRLKIPRLAQPTRPRPPIVCWPVWPAIAQSDWRAQCRCRSWCRAQCGATKSVDAFAKAEPECAINAFASMARSEGRSFSLTTVRPDDITEHRSRRATPRETAQNVVREFRSIHLRNSVNGAPGMEGIGVIVVEHDNLAFQPSLCLSNRLDRRLRGRQIATAELLEPHG